MNKFHNRKKNGFDSVKEFNRYRDLMLLQKAGKISGLSRQIRFDLLPPQYDGDKCVLRGCYYVADFTYWENGNFIVEDCKGYKTPDYVIKKKLMYYFHNILIKET